MQTTRTVVNPNSHSRAPFPIALFVLAIGAAVVEAVVLQALGFVSALPLAPQLSAPAPFGTFHDLRWVWTYAWSWGSVAWQLIALLAFRSIFDTLVIAAAWPRDYPRPGMFRLWRRSLLYVVIAIVVMSPWATMTFAAGVTGDGWFLLAAIIASLVMALVMPAGIVTGEWWRRILPWRTMPHVLLAWVVLMLAALAITFSPPWLTVIIAGACGAVNAFLWRRIVITVIAAGEPRYTIPLAPIAIVIVLGIFVAGGGWLYGNSRGSGKHGSKQPAKSLKSRPAAQPATASNGYPVVFVNGFSTRYDGRQYELFGPGIASWYYSYNGIDDTGHPKPYSPRDTHQSLGVSASYLAYQVNRLHQATGKPVTVVADSEGTMIARAYFAANPHPPVDRYIQSSPLLRPSRVYYPPAGQEDYGLVAGWEAREILTMIRLESPAFHDHADMPFLRSMVDRAPLLRDQTLCPIPGVQTFMFIPLQAAMMAERGPLSRIPWVALPGWHATLLRRKDVQEDVRHLLNTGHLRSRPGWAFAFQLLRGAGAAWQSPALPLQLRPAWHAAPHSDPAFGGYNCSQEE
ncbi:MAG TPA: hypothetical protein VFM97_11815 [Gammaproteobacteria bacterium]|nr:hypothetical protein [Gammaproteobacteria bacterium]